MEKEKRIPSLEIETESGYLPVINPEVYETKNGLAYLQEPGVAVISVPHVDLRGIQGFLDGFPEELGFRDYLKDPPVNSVMKASDPVAHSTNTPTSIFKMSKSRVMDPSLNMQTSPCSGGEFPAV